MVAYTTPLATVAPLVVPLSEMCDRRTRLPSAASNAYRLPPSLPMVRNRESAASRRPPVSPPYAAEVRQVLPLFPLSTVLYPGLVLPLNIFEERYRTLVVHLLAPGHGAAEFGVVAIRHGRETDPLGNDALYGVGCVARVRRANKLPDGRFHLVTTGTERFQLVSLGEPAPYPSGEVELLDEPTGDVDDGLVESVRDGFTRYLGLLGGDLAPDSTNQISDDPQALSYLVAATMALSLPDRQRLLEEPDAASRLRAERALLALEYSLISALGSLPATDLTRDGFSAN